MNDTKAQAIRKAYIDPIRSVMLVDERFPNYSDLQDVLQALRSKDMSSAFGASVIPDLAGLGGHWQADLALELWRACREQGWVCDVENKHFENIGPLKKADLIVLDYLLDNQSPAHALGLLEKLADADRSRLVILYTNEEKLSDVRRRVACHLRGADADAQNRLLKKLAEAIGQVDDIDELADRLDDLKQHIDEELLDRYLLGDVRGVRTVLAPRIPKDLRKYVGEVSEYLCETTLIAHEAPTPKTGRAIEFGQGGPVWLVCQNLFVAFVSKNQKSSAVFAALEAALSDWDPTPLHLSLAYARDVISRKGFEVERSLSGKPALEVGLTYFALTEGSRRGTRVLFEKVWEAFGYEVVAELAEFGNALINGDDGDDSLGQAKRLCRSNDIKQEEIFQRLNVFLCSQDHHGLFLRTGTILGNPDENEVWICVTPLCDLDPRPPKLNSWNHKLAPFREVKLRRAEIVSATERVLNNVTDLEYVFWEFEQKLMCARVADVRMETVLVEADGRILDRSVKMRRVRLASDGATLELQEHSMQVLGQLRDQNASMLLQHSGTHSSRIGVDFVKSPESPKKQDGDGVEKANKK
jgi:hypothetical protein